MMKQERNQFIMGLFYQEYRKLLRVALRLTEDKETSLDLVQDTFVLATLHYDILKDHPNPEAWMMLTLYNLVRNELRKQRRHPSLPLDAAANVATETDAARSLEELLPSRLSDDDRNILKWRFEQQMDYQEMSVHLGISEAACRSRVSRAVARCKELLR